MITNSPDRRRSSAALPLAAALLALGTGCAGKRTYVWASELPASASAPADTAYKIGPGDVLGVRVWNQDAMSIERARVREDGRISLPFLNDVEVAGMEPAELGKRLEVKLKTFIVNPVVTVLVQERALLRISVLGEVVRPGVYELEKGTGVLHAIAAAGGLSPFAADAGLYVLRTGHSADTPAPARVRFRYSELREGRAPAALFRLRSGDVVVAE